MLDIILALDRCFKLTFKYYRNRNHITPLRKRPSGIYILTGVSAKNVLELGNFPPGCPCQVTVSVCHFKYTQMMYAWYLKVVPGKSRTGSVKLKISPVTGEGKFKGLISKIHRGARFNGLSYRGVLLNYIATTVHYRLINVMQRSLSSNGKDHAPVKHNIQPRRTWLKCSEKLLSNIHEHVHSNLRPLTLGTLCSRRNGCALWILNLSAMGKFWTEYQFNF